MKRAIKLAALLTAALMSGCTKKAPVEAESSRIVWGFSNICESGEFTMSGERLDFTDFETLVTAPVCAKPNCAHDNKSCSAYGMGNHPILHGESIYFFDVETSFENGEITETTTAYKADKDGSNRRKAGTLDDLTLFAYSRMLLIGEKAYFSAAKQEFDEYGSSTGNCEIFLCEYDFSEEKFREITRVFSGNAQQIWIYGKWNGRIYFQYSYLTHPEDFQYVFDPDDPTALPPVPQPEDFTFVYKCYDLGSGEIKDSDKPAPICVDGGYYVYEKDGGTAFLSENGTEIFFENTVFTDGLVILNDRAFDARSDICADLSKKELHSLNIEKSAQIKALFNDKYIIKSYKTDDEGFVLGNEYKALSADELIGEKL